MKNAAECLIKTLATLVATAFVYQAGIHNISNALDHVHLRSEDVLYVTVGYHQSLLPEAAPQPVRADAGSARAITM